MRMRRYCCRGCNLLFHCDLEQGEGIHELIFCPLCGTAGTVEPDSEEFSLCPGCVERLPVEADDADEPSYFLA
jgi:hypothetical protein